MPDHARSRRKAFVGFATAVTALVAVTVAPAHAVPLAATGERDAVESIREVDGDLVGNDPNFIGVIPGSGICSWEFNVAGEQPGIVYSALTCERPRGRTHALVGTNPAAGCNDSRVCAFLERSSIIWR